MADFPIKAVTQPLWLVAMQEQETQRRGLFVMFLEFKIYLVSSTDEEREKLISSTITTVAI
jgi:hypothetical protein